MAKATSLMFIIISGPSFFTGCRERNSFFHKDGWFGSPAGSGAVRVANGRVWVSAYAIQKVWVRPTLSKSTRGVLKSKDGIKEARY